MRSIIILEICHQIQVSLYVLALKSFVSLNTEILCWKKCTQTRNKQIERKTFLNSQENATVSQRIKWYYQERKNKGEPDTSQNENSSTHLSLFFNNSISLLDHEAIMLPFMLTFHINYIGSYDNDIWSKLFIIPTDTYKETIILPPRWVLWLHLQMVTNPQWPPRRIPWTMLLCLLLKKRVKGNQKPFWWSRKLPLSFLW